MIEIIASEKGSGKTKSLIKKANDAVLNTDGNIVFIDDDKRHMYDLKRDIRFVDTTDFPLSNYRELVGFIYGILSQNNDITEIFIDGLNNVITNFDDDALIKIIRKFNILTENKNVNIFFSLNANPDKLPDVAKALLAK